MKHGIVLGAGIGAGFLSWLFNLAEGYFANPAPPPFGVLYPFFLIPIAAAPILVSIGYCVWLVSQRKTRRNIGLTLVSLVGPFVVVAGPTLINDYDTFVYRMKSFSEAEYHRLAADVKTEFDKKGVDQLRDYGSSRKEQLAIHETLVQSHPILAISEFPLDIAVRDENVVLEWGSGLTGGYEVVISLSSDPTSGWVDARRRGPHDVASPVTYIYDGVALLRLP